MVVRPELRLSPIPGVTAFCTQQTVWAERRSPFQKETCGPCPLPFCTRWCPLPKQPHFPKVQLQWARIWGGRTQTGRGQVCVGETERDSCHWQKGELELAVHEEGLSVPSSI